MTRSEQSVRATRAHAHRRGITVEQLLTERVERLERQLAEAVADLAAEQETTDAVPR